MFLLATKLTKHENLMYAVKPLYSYGYYRWKFLSRLFKYEAYGNSDFYYNYHDLSLLKYLTTEVLSNLELDEAVKTVQIQIKKNLQTYQGLRLALDLPVRGQWTRTNASTQWLLAHNPRRRHFVQKKNRRKFAKDQKKAYFKNKIKENEKI
jgi:ribosomal protein S13